MLLAADAVYVALAVALQAGVLTNPYLGLDVDAGYPEMYQYVKALWVVLCAGALWWRRRQPVFAVIAAAFAFVIADDAGVLHERLGLRLARALGIGDALGLRTQDFGEVLFFALVGAALLGAGWMAYRRSDRPARRVARYAAAAVVALAVFGVGVDVLHQLAPEGGRLHVALGVVEDGGELAVMSAVASGAVAAAYGWWPFSDRPPRGARR